MSLQKQVLDFVAVRGIKKGWIARQVGMTPSDFSQWLRYRLIVNSDIEDKIAEIIAGRSSLQCVNSAL